MWWPLGKRFDLWVDASPDQILHPIKDQNENPFSHYEYIDPPEVEVSGNIIAVPGFGPRMELSRQIWATYTPFENGVRVKGRYGLSLAGLSIAFPLSLLVTCVMVALMLRSDGPTLSETFPYVGFTLGILIWDRVTRPFAKTRYDDFVGYLERVSKDGAVHPLPMKVMQEA